MRTQPSTVTFQRPFTLNRGVGELPPGTYDIEIDEEEIQAIDRTAYRRVAIYFYVQNSASTRTIAVTPADLESALKRDLTSVFGQADADADERAVDVGRVA
jgi:hypothetical protein